jgi:hypothetical protein
VHNYFLNAALVLLPFTGNAALIENNRKTIGVKTIGVRLQFLDK